MTKHSEESEKALEQYLRKRCKENGWPCLKYSNPSDAGYPDRLIVLPYGKVAWVELKSKGCKPTRLQKERHKELCALYHHVTVADTREIIDEAIKEINHGNGI